MADVVVDLLSGQVNKRQKPGLPVMDTRETVTVAIHDVVLETLRWRKMSAFLLVLLFTCQVESNREFEMDKLSTCGQRIVVSENNFVTIRGRSDISPSNPPTHCEVILESINRDSNYRLQLEFKTISIRDGAIFLKIYDGQKSGTLLRQIGKGSKSTDIIYSQSNFVTLILTAPYEKYKDYDFTVVVKTYDDPDAAKKLVGQQRLSPGAIIGIAIGILLIIIFGVTLCWMHNTGRLENHDPMPSSSRSTTKEDITKESLGSAHKDGISRSNEGFNYKDPLIWNTVASGYMTPISRRSYDNQSFRSSRSGFYDSDNLYSDMDYKNMNAPDNPDRVSYKRAGSRHLSSGSVTFDVREKEPENLQFSSYKGGQQRGVSANGRRNSFSKEGARYSEIRFDSQSEKIRGFYGSQSSRLQSQDPNRDSKQSPHSGRNASKEMANYPQRRDGIQSNGSRQSPHSGRSASKERMYSQGRTGDEASLNRNQPQRKDVIQASGSGQNSHLGKRRAPQSNSRETSVDDLAIYDKEFSQNGIQSAAVELHSGNINKPNDELDEFKEKLQATEAAPSVRQQKHNDEGLYDYDHIFSKKSDLRSSSPVGNHGTEEVKHTSGSDPHGQSSGLDKHSNGGFRGESILKLPKTTVALSDDHKNKSQRNPDEIGFPDDLMYKNDEDFPNLADYSMDLQSEAEEPARIKNPVICSSHIKQTMADPTIPPDSKKLKGKDSAKGIPREVGQHRRKDAPFLSGDEDSQYGSRQQHHYGIPEIARQTDRGYNGSNFPVPAGFESIIARTVKPGFDAAEARNQTFAYAYQSQPDAHEASSDNQGYAGKAAWYVESTPTRQGPIKKAAFFMQTSLTGSDTPSRSSSMDNVLKQPNMQAPFNFSGPELTSTPASFSTQPLNNCDKNSTDIKSPEKTYSALTSTHSGVSRPHPIHGQNIADLQPGQRSTVAKSGYDPSTGCHTTQIAWVDTVPDPTDPPGPIPSIARKTVTRVTTRSTYGELPELSEPILNQISIQSQPDHLEPHEHERFLSPSSQGVYGGQPPVPQPVYAAEFPAEDNVAYYLGRQYDKHKPIVHEATNRSKAIKLSVPMTTDA